jgi:t-SNARE complex subunit (syntaxin)
VQVRLRLSVWQAQLRELRELANSLRAAVQAQQRDIDEMEANAEAAAHNVSGGTQQLSRAAELKHVARSLVFPVVGGVVLLYRVRDRDLVAYVTSTRKRPSCIVWNR